MEQRRNNKNMLYYHLLTNMLIDVLIYLLLYVMQSTLLTKLMDYTNPIKQIINNYDHEINDLLML
jgi:hypothetical protein